MDWLRKFQTHGQQLLSDLSEISLSTSTGGCCSQHDCSGSLCSEIDNVTTHSGMSVTQLQGCLSFLRYLLNEAVLTLTQHQYCIDAVSLKHVTGNEKLTLDALVDLLILPKDHSAFYDPTKSVTSSSSTSCAATVGFTEKHPLQSELRQATIKSSHSSDTSVCSGSEHSEQVPSEKLLLTKAGQKANKEVKKKTVKRARSQVKRSRKTRNDVEQPEKKSQGDVRSDCDVVAADDSHLTNSGSTGTVLRRSRRNLCKASSSNDHTLADDICKDSLSDGNEEEDWLEDKCGKRRKMSDNETWHRSSKNTSTLTRDHCLVLKQPVCCMCGALFGSMPDCINHWRQDHIKHDPLGVRAHIPCCGCTVKFSLPASRLDSDLHVEVQIARWLNHAVRTHGNAVPLDAATRFICTETNCSFTTFTPATFKAHKSRIQHSSAGKGASSLVYFEYRCFLCPPPKDAITFPSKQVLREHITACHVFTKDTDAGPMMKCPQCGVERRLNQSGDRQFIHRPPNRRFYHVLYRLLHHLVSKHGWSVPEYIQSYRCTEPGCMYVGVAKSDVDGHAISHDGKPGVPDGGRNPSAPCEKCGKLVKYRAMRSHLRICQVSLDSRKTISCPHCSIRLSSRYSLGYHIRAVHADITGMTKDFLCSHCTYSCRLKGNLEEHIYHRHGVNVSRRPIVSCDECDFMTIKQGALRRHCALVHNATKSFRCQVCDKMFKCELHLRSHMVAHQERKFPCTLCSYRAARKANLMAHVKAQHGAVGDRRPFRCDEPCGYTTGYAANLSKHQRLFCKFRRRAISSTGSGGVMTTTTVTNTYQPIVGIVHSGVQEPSNMNLYGHDVAQMSMPMSYDATNYRWNPSNTESAVVDGNLSMSDDACAIEQFVHDFGFQRSSEEREFINMAVSLLPH